MIAFIRRGHWRALCAVAILLALTACVGGGSGSNNNQLPGDVPSIFGLSKSSANSGDQVSILGSNFGSSQGSGTVELGTTSLTVDNWSDSQIDVTIPSGAKSGIIVVTQNGNASESGQEAQLFIGAAPSVAPVILSISPDAARAGQDEVSIVGTGFGSAGAGSSVFFSAAGGTVAGVVATNVATGNPQWTATNVRVLVPTTAISGPVYLQTSNGASNSVQLDVLPPQVDVNNIKILTVTPTGGPEGTTLQISGDNFGIAQGNSRVYLEGAGGNNREMVITTWSDNAINANIPVGATTGTLHVIVNGVDVVYSTPITVALKPVITAVEPGELHIGGTLTVLGKNFGDTAGTLKVGTTTIAADKITSWSDTEIDLAKLPAVQLPNIQDPHLDVQVTSLAGIDSDPFTVKLISDLIGAVTVTPKTGIATKTQFTFTVNASGADNANFEYTLYPNINDANTKVVSSSPQIKYTYPTGGTFNTQVKIEDKNSGDFIILNTPNSPTIKVGNVNDVVVVDFGPLDFASGQIPGENPFTYLQTSPGVFTYSDFLFSPALPSPFNIWFTTGIDNGFTVNGNSTQFTRDQGSFLYGTAKTKPYGYRRTNAGGTVRIHGYNFGSAQGSVWLASNKPNDGVQVSQIDAWNVQADGVTPADPNSDGYIDITLPTSDNGISGKIVVVNAGSGNFGQSADPLVVSPRITVAPGQTVAAARSLGLDNTATDAQFIGFDFLAPTIPGITGNQTYIFWACQVSYNDPFNNDAPVTKKLLCVNPFPVSITNGNSIDFDMTQLAANGQDFEAFDSTGTQYQIVDNTNNAATLVGGTYSAFLWSGALPADGSVSGNLLANSGVMSEFKDVNVKP